MLHQVSLRLLQRDPQEPLQGLQLLRLVPELPQLRRVGQQLLQPLLLEPPHEPPVGIVPGLAHCI